MTDLGIYLGPIKENIDANREVINGEAVAEELDWGVEIEEKLKTLPEHTISTC